MAANDNVELRGLCQRETIDILDAVSLSRRISRIELVNEILAAWCTDELRRATLVYRAAHGNPQPADSNALVVKATGGNPQLMEARGR